ncbi:hypothetical protein ACSVH5_11780 [Flavobacterium sp. RSSA_27]|uniref:hypothetical protein n=1 Tax=Flavobacterium sp. RSSA_27 TaxID=3447667 RepID=UPI003F315A12
MAKVFRFHTDNNTIEDWQNSQSYGSNAINGIQDPEGGKASKQITSIPSPFARIDIVKTAFEYVTNIESLDGTTIYHKMVSDSFDVAELFFNIDKFSDKLKIIVWDPNTDLSNLLNSTNEKHRLLGKTLDLFLKQDAKANNFDKMKRLYLLNYTNGPDQMNIIGGTSPATLFFNSANDLSYVKAQFGNDKVFDNEFQPLYKRNFEFQKYIYGLRLSNPNFNSDFKAVNDYLNLNYRQLSQEEKNIINNLTEAEFENQYCLQQINEGNQVEILGMPLRKKVESLESIEKASGFTIESSIYDDIKPLVLPIDTLTESIKYISANWDCNNKVPFFDNESLENRKLPFEGTKYPYLTVGDFLEDYIIATPYPIDNTKYFTANLNGDSKKGYLLPIKELFFKFFDSSFLMGHMHDGKKNFEIKEGIQNSITAILRIPIKDKKYITYTKIYKRPIEEHQMAEIDQERNIGAIIENRFNITIYPFHKSIQGNPSYRVGIMNVDNHPQYQHSEYNFTFYNQKGKLNSTIHKTRRSNRAKGDELTSDYFILADNFNYIRVEHQWANGILIPLLKEQYGVGKFTFAVDFGTTNTHIEYKKDGGHPIAFEISDNDAQIEPLFLWNDYTQGLFNQSTLGLFNDNLEDEQIPKKINFFPTRTVLSSNEELNYNQAVHTLADTNIPFYYQKKISRKNTVITSNLKWDTVEFNEKRVESFLEKIILLVRNKVILEKGDLDQTELIWMYPTSMSTYKVNQFQNIWIKLFNKHINKNEPIRVSESLTPFYYYRNEKGVMAGQNSVLSIDIGGGTTDVVIYKDNQPCLATSFRFAGNALFGDAFGDRNANMSGFVQHFIIKYKNLLSENHLIKLSEVFDQLIYNRKSEEIISFLFSLENNEEVNAKALDISFTNDLYKNSEFKIVITLFYAAIIYHIATILKKKDIVFPRYITFSGTGSKIVNLIGNQSTLQKLSQIIIETILENKDNTKIDIKSVNNPKEISCKGALYQTPQDRQINMKEIEYTHVSNDATVTTEKLKYSDLNDSIYNTSKQEFFEFIDCFFQIKDKFNFKDELGINPTNFEKYREYLVEDTIDNLKKGVEVKKRELNGNVDEILSETLFFYPIIGGLNNLAYKIHQELS